MLWLALLLVSEDPGFGGAPTSSPAPAANSGECVIQGDDGVWRSCDEAIAMKQAQREAERAVRDADRVEDDEPVRAPEPPAPEAPPEQKKTELQLEIERSGLDPKLPLLALRIRVAELREELDFLDQHGMPPSRKDPIEKELRETTLLLGDVEQLAMSRLMVCARNTGHEIKLKRVRMTAAGPVNLTMQEMIAQLPLVDPPGCERIYLVDEDAVNKVKRAHELFLLLHARTFGYYERDRRKALEKEQAELDAWLKKEGVPALEGRIRT